MPTKPLTFILLLVSSWTNAQKIIPIDQGPTVGKEFPLFNYVNLEGDSVKSDQFEKSILIINIWFVGCKGCKQEEPYLKEITEHYQDNNKLKFIGFCMSSEKRIRKYFLKNHDFGYDQVSISKKEVEDKFSAITSPTHFIIKDGILIAKYTGPLVPFTDSLDWFKNELSNIE